MKTLDADRFQQRPAGEDDTAFKKIVAEHLADLVDLPLTFGGDESVVDQNIDTNPQAGLTITHTGDNEGKADDK